MKILKFLYQMKIEFDMPVKGHHFTLKCIPHDGQGQVIEGIRYKVYPNRYISRSTDSFANECIYGFCEEEHDHFMVEVEGVARTGVGGVCDEDPSKSIFKYQTQHTMPGEELIAYHRKLDEQYPGRKAACGETDTCESKTGIEGRAIFYMHSLYRDFVYESGSTAIGTTAEEALVQGKGVCQDYAHILLSLLRQDGIPCRYVAGMMFGEGFSHAWVEVYCEKGWIALDPTNDLVVDDSHIAISRGRDYSDCLLNQGIFVGTRGKAQQIQTILVEVWEM